MTEEIIVKQDSQSGDVPVEYEKPEIKTINTEYELNGIVGIYVVL